ncbi:hypothetical protein [Mycobacterium sp.]|uniref:hypothetical protein n=1 Tax=Mycobacterium sp. TaxID=1785 RepID=UPI003340F4A4
MTLMTIFDRFNITVVASAGLCGAAIALSQAAAAAPLITGGYACIQASAGDTAPSVAATGPVADGGCGPASAPLADMAGIPLTLPGPVPVGAPLGAPVPVGVIDVAAGYGGKGAPTGPPPAGAPVPGQPVLPGPWAAPPAAG